MNHDAEHLDAQEFLQMDYKHCLMYMAVFFEIPHSGRLFPVDHGSFGLRSNELPEEIEDKINAMINRGYLINHSNHYHLLSIGPRGFNLMEDKCLSPEILGVF